MRAPQGLGGAARAAFRRAADSVDNGEDRDRLVDAVCRYAFAVDLADRARREWRSVGAPLTIAHPNGIVAQHPLIAVMRDAERDAARYGEAVGLKPGRVARRGPDPVATIAADLGESPAAKLRRVR